jgi:voltage-gated potassium channel
VDSFNETRRQVRLALLALVLIVCIGVSGYMLIEGMSPLDAIWMTIETLTTIGYGDIVPRTAEGRVFTLFLIIVGLSIFAYGIQASSVLLISPSVRQIRQRQRIQRTINRLQHHYIICGAGELVDKTSAYLIESAARRRSQQLDTFYQPLDTLMRRLLGSADTGALRRLHRPLRAGLRALVRQFHRGETLLDVVVVITPDAGFAHHLREHAVMVVEGDPTEDDTLRLAGVDHAQAMMVMLDADTETLLTVLTARNLNAHLDITATTLDDHLAAQMIRIGANSVIAPYDSAGQFLNSATLRPAVNGFFTSILYAPDAHSVITELHLWDDSPWIGKRPRELNLRERFEAGIIGLRHDSGIYSYMPSDDYLLAEGDIIIAVAPAHRISPLQAECRASAGQHPRSATWQRLPQPISTPASPSMPAESGQNSQPLSEHFIICGCGRIARSAIKWLNPQRPFVVISDDEAYTAELRERGFSVVHGQPEAESVLRQAGVEQAQAIMVVIDDPAASVLAVLNSRSRSKRLLITAAAQNDQMIAKLQRAGADRVVSPFDLAAQFVLIAATRPVVSDFLQHIIFNYQTGIETTELYMQDNSPWLGHSIASLGLAHYQAGVIGLRAADGSYQYAPPSTHILRINEVLIVVTPMVYADELRAKAHGGFSKKPVSLRRSASG